MTLFLDSWYTIGKLHLFCEDYVCLGEQPFPYLILADGCSAAPDSDLGARLLVLNARCLLPRFALGASDKVSRAARHWRLGRRIIRRAARQARDLGLDEGVLDATLLIAWCENDTVHIHLYGDGCIVTRSVEGAVAAIQVEYAENAPYYLSYLLDAERGALYQEAIGDAQIGQSVRYLHGGGVTLRQEPFNTPTVFSFNLTTFPTVAVATDGLHSFISADTGKRVDLLEVAGQLLDFSNLAPGFVKRRTHEVLVEYGRKRVVHLDDLGWGAFVRVGDPSDV
jgi:hypothetical protein